MLAQPCKVAAPGEPAVVARLVSDSRGGAVLGPLLDPVLTDKNWNC